MKKNIFLAFGMSAALIFSGCSILTPTDVEPITEEDAQTEEETGIATEEVTETETETEEETESETDEETEEETESEDSTQQTNSDGSLVIDIGTDEEESLTSSSGRMEEVTKTYTYNNVTINYPVIVGMSDEDVQSWANEELYNDAMSIIDIYDVDIENDTLFVEYDVSTIYKGEISLVYSGTLEQESTSGTISIRLADDLDLSLQEHIRLSDRLSASKLISTVLETGDYEVISTNFDEETLREYLSSQSEDFYTSLISTADFGGDEEPEGFSYNYLGNVAIIIPVPHMFGDYAEITIEQQTK